MYRKTITAIILLGIAGVNLTLGGPTAPTGVTASAGDGQVSISWSAVSGATSYNIYWSTTSGVTKTNGTKITDATSPYSHTGRTNGTTYYYIVTAVNSSGESVESAQVSETPVGTQVGTDFPIANTSGREMSIGSAFDGTNFLVGIQGDATAAQSITAQFVSKTGALVGSRISIGDTGGAPSVAFDGTNYLLAWAEDAEYSTFIAGRFVSTSGALVGSQFYIATGGTDIRSQNIIFDGTNYFVAWENRWSSEWGTSDLFGQFITPSGAKLGSVISISTAAYGQRELSIAFDGANILAVWIDGRNLSAYDGTNYHESDVYGQFITKSGASAAGTLSGSNFLIDAGTLPRDNPTGIGFDGTNYLVTFIEQTEFDGPIWEAYGILVTNTGATIGSKFVIGNTATNQKFFPMPAYLGTKYLVTWTDGFGTTSASMKGIYVTASGTVEGSEFTLFSPASSGAVPWLGMVFTGGGVNLAITNWGIPNATDPFDFDLYTSADVMGAIITNPFGSISGTISYSGTQTGTIEVGAFTDPDFSGEPDYFVEDLSLGDYTLSNLSDGTYYIVSVMVTDEEIKKTDPWGVYGTLENPTPVTITGGSSELGIDITLVDGTEENPNPFYYFVDAWSQNWSYGEQYVVHFSVADPNHEATSVEIRGPGIADSLSIDYDNNRNEWNSWHTGKSLDFGSSPPAPPLTYTFTIVDPSMTTVKTDTATVESFVSVYATDLSPSGGETVSDPLVFSWTGVGAGYTYSVELNDAEWNRIWDAEEDLTTTSVIYDGPALTPGAEYFYWVVVGDEYGNQSFAEANFVYQAAGTGSISGQVADPNGSKLAGVNVQLYIGDDENIADKDAWNYYGSTTTDPNGQYRFDLLPQRRYRVHVPDQEVSGTHYFETDLYNVQVLAGSETINMNQSLKQAGLIYGSVKTAGGIPIPNAEVIAQASWTDEGQSWHNVWTDSDGKYEFWVAPSPGAFYPVWVRLASLDGTVYESKWDGNLYQATLAGIPGPDYLLEEGGIATGRVVNESNVGINDVQIQGQWSEYGSATQPWAVTDPNGDFSLSSLPSGINYIALENDWREIQQDDVKYMAGDAYRGPITITAGGTVNVGTFTIYEAGTVTGIVTNESGVPVVAAEVWIEGRDINGNYSEREDVVTDSFGQFTIDYVAPGTYYLRTTKEGLLPSIVTNIAVARGQHVDLDDVILKSANEGATLSGRITNYTDIAWYDSDHVQLPCYEESNYDNFGFNGFGLLAISMEHTYTESDYLDIDSLFVGMLDSEDIDDGYGDYFQDDPNETRGSYQMMLTSGDIAIGMYTYHEFLPGDGGCVILHDWKRFNLTKGDSLSNVDFTAVTTSTGTLKGNITVPAGYNYFPEGWCSVYAYALDPNGNTINSIQLGDAVAFPGCTTTYEFRDLPAGTYRLKAYARNLASVIVPSVTVGIGGTTIQDITFTAGGTLSGQVTDGVAVSGAVVTIIETGKQAVTDASGNYIIKGMNTGTYTVKASALGYADAQETVQVTEGSVTTQNFALSSTVGSISGTVKDNSDANINGATVAAYNETDKTSRTCKTVGGAFSIGQLTPGQYILAVNTDAYGVVVYPEGANRITLLPNQNITGININVGAPKPPSFTVSSSASTEPVVLSMTFYSDPNLLAVPSVEIVDGNGVKGSLTSNTALNRFEIDYTANANDNLVRIKIEETTPLVPGSPASKTFSFEVGANLVMTSSTNVTNATGGTARIMGTQDNTEIYVPPFAIAGAPSDSQAITLTIERYGDPGDPVEGTDANSVTAVYDFKFEDGVSVDENHTFTVTMSFQLPAGMTQQEFEDTLVVRYFDAGDQQWKTDGITNVRINWANSTIIFEVSHLSKFAGFTQSGVYHPADKNSDEVIGISEIVSYINKWAAGEVSISDVVKGINLWAAGHYYWDSSAQKFKPGTQP